MLVVEGGQDKQLPGIQYRADVQLPSTLARRLVMNRPTITNTLLITTMFLGSGVGVGQSQPPLVELEEQAMSDTLQYSLEYNKTNQAADWVNPDTSHTGTVVPVLTFVNNLGEPCREFITTITIDGEQQQGYGTACRQTNGTWYTVNDGPPARVATVTRQPVQVYQPPERYYSPPNMYYNPYPFQFSFSLGYLFHDGGRRHGQYHPSGPMWYPRTHWRPHNYRYYPSSWQRPYNRPNYWQRPHRRSHQRW